MYWACRRRRPVNCFDGDRYPRFHGSRLNLDIALALWESDFKLGMFRSFGKQFSIIIRSLHLIADRIYLLYQIQSLLQNHTLLLLWSVLRLFWNMFVYTDLQQWHVVKACKSCFAWPTNFCVMTFIFVLNKGYYGFGTKLKKSEADPKWRLFFSLENNIILRKNWSFS